MIFGKDQLVFDLPESGKKQTYIGPCDVEMPDFAKRFGACSRKEKLDFPNLAETTVVRHFTNASLRNYGVENGMYPLGSCTMKYNPKINEDMAALPGFAFTHPLQPVSTVQGNLELLYNLQGGLSDLTGMDAWTFQPSAGAHGELTGVLVIKAYHEDRGDHKRRIMLIPDSAHGTNPASAAMAGFDVVELKSSASGLVDLEDLKSKLSDEVAGMMLTNPNTLGYFEKDAAEITKLVHEAGGLMYYDGANLNAIMMHVRPGDMGFDVVHLNVHKTLSTPHGGGGPGAGPVGVKSFLKEFLPRPTIDKKETGEYFLDYDRPKSIGKVRGYNGSFAIFVRTFAYIEALGAKGLYDASEGAVANANYIKERLKDIFVLPYDTDVMHEAAMSGIKQKERGCSTLHMCKRLMDYGLHAPTMYFPNIVEESLMIEPTETEDKASLDAFVEAIKKIDEETKTNPDVVNEAPHNTPICQPDEATAARYPVLKYGDVAKK